MIAHSYSVCEVEKILAYHKASYSSLQIVEGFIQVPHIRKYIEKLIAERFIQQYELELELAKLGIDVRSCYWQKDAQALFERYLSISDYQKVSFAKSVLLAALDAEKEMYRHYLRLSKVSDQFPSAMETLIKKQMLHFRDTVLGLRALANGVV